MKVTFVAPSARRPVGGATVLYELATALAARQVDVQLVHLDVWDDALASTGEIPWFTFPQEMDHHFQRGADFDGGRHLPPADVLIGYAPNWETSLDQGLPVIPIQGYRMLGRAFEDAMYRARCPKLCVASWLVDVGRRLDVPATQLLHVPPGLRHEKYRITRPIERRPRRVAYCYNAHPGKRPSLALDVLERVRRAVPDLEVVLFSSIAPEHDIPCWIDVRVDPSQHELVEEIYNGSRVFLCTSDVEGFGMPCIEAMACGAALVTTDNGGSRDYARHERTAVVATPGDATTLAAHVIDLLGDDVACTQLATRGAEEVRSFRWDRSGDLLHDLLQQYCNDPSAFGLDVATFAARG